MNKPHVASRVILAALACWLSLPVQAAIRDDERIVRVGERIEQLGERLKWRLERIESAAKGEDLEDLLEDQATDLTEYEALDLDRFLHRDGDRSGGCKQAREERAREMRHREEEVGAARRSLTEAGNAREQENAKARLRRQREHLRREVEKTRETLARVCGEEGPDRPTRFTPPGHLKDRGVGHHFAPGKGHEKFDPDADYGHMHRGDSDVPPGHEKRGKKGSSGKKGKK